MHGTAGVLEEAMNLQAMFLVGNLMSHLSWCLVAPMVRGG